MGHVDCEKEPSHRQLISIVRPSIQRLVMTLCLALVAIGLTGCMSKDHFAGSEGKVKVTATTGMIADIVKEVGQEHVAVIGLMGPGVDPHLYKASQGDLAKLEQADVIFYNGLFLEGKLIDIFERMANKKTIIAVSRNIDPDQLRSGTEEMGSEYDPHIWFDVKLWMRAVEEVRDVLIATDSAHAEDYRKYTDAYLAQLAELDREVNEKIASIPEQSRVLVTAHDAFGYFGDAYGIKVKGLQGLSTASEAGSKDVADLRDYLVHHKIKAVFVESSIPKKAIEAVIQGARQKGHEVVIGGELFSDAMGEVGTVEGTYIGMMRHNVDTIVNALK